MCGIAGIINKKKFDSPDFDISINLNHIKKIINHRGPNESGMYTHSNFGFLNVRLSIVDIASGKQPIFNQDKTIGIVFNGEIYNYLDLKKELVSKGCRFQTQTDTEVILKAYEKFGTKSFSKLNGMFAFCIWDENKKLSYLVRDRFGIKPIYYYNDNNRLIFSSELKAIIATKQIDLTLDPVGFQDYLIFRYIQSPYSLFKKVKRLDPGTFLKINLKNGIFAQYRFEDLNIQEEFPPKPESSYTKDLDIKLSKSVNSMLMGEVPVGVLLSGGVDSSTIAYYVHKINANLTTFNIGFPEVNEFEYSRSIAKHFNLKHIEITTTIDQLISVFKTVNYFLDEPLADPACLPLFVLCKELKKHVTVVLSGEGADELFGGYPQYVQTLENNKISFEKKFEYFLERSWYFNDHLKFLNNILSIPPIEYRHRKYFEGQNLLNGMLLYDLKTWLPDNLMMKGDKILMANSLEGRFPFLDNDIFLFSAKLPHVLKINSAAETKYILKKTVMPYLPQTIINRPKMGFTVPVELLLTKMKSTVLDTLKNPASSLKSILNFTQINQLSQSFYRGDKKLALQLWTIFTLVYWFSNSFIDYKKSILPDD